MQPLKEVFDTNIFVMAAGMPGGYVNYWLDFAKPPQNKFLLYSSPVILAEVQEKLEERLKFTRPLAVEYIEAIKSIATVVNPRVTLDEVPTDPDDNRILECAIEANADLVITADRDLLSLKSFRGVQIFHPSNLKYIFKYLENDI
jgi:putative PIN family toxin of toxin-antitoxin system